jgi:cytidylate kinase
MLKKHSQPMHMKKKNIITIGGTSGCGKSGTVKRLLRILQAYAHYSTGDTVRALAAEVNVPIEEFRVYASKNNIDFDSIVDNRLKEISEKENFYLVDCRLGVYFIRNSFKVLLKVDPLVGAARRLADYRKIDPSKYDETTAQDILQSLRKRDEDNHQQYVNLYQFSIDDESYYDLVIDTTKKSIDEVCNEILDGFVYWLKTPYLLEK